MKGIRIVIAAAIVVLSLASAVGANAAADPTTPNFEEASGPLDATDQTLPQAVPGKATLGAPSGTITTLNPTYYWNVVSGSTWYCLWIEGPSGKIYNKWYTSAEVASLGSWVCAITPAMTLTPGNSYTWWIQTWNDDGYGPWSDSKSFMVAGSPSMKTTLVLPSGTIGQTQPTYQWNPESASTWYDLWINGPSGKIFEKWYTSDEVTSGSICQVTPTLTLTPGNSYTWWVQTWNNNGYGPWSDPMGFMVSGSTPGKATLISPSGTITSTQPIYQWGAISESTRYYLWIAGPSGMEYWSHWYTASEITSGSICQVTPAVTLIPGSSYTWWIQTGNDAGYGPWSDPMSFMVSIPPGKAVLVSPTGTITSTQPIYMWNPVSGSTWYDLRINGPSGKIFEKWYTSDEVTSGSSCWIAPALTLTPGSSYTWRIQTWNDAGYGPWSDAKPFAVS